jgi:hypothetical protein
MSKQPSKKPDQDSKDHGRDHYMEGVDAFVQALAPDLSEEPEDEQDKPIKDASYYRRTITQRAKAMMQARGEWKLRPKTEKPKGQSTPKPATPSAPATTSPQPRSNHGKAPQAPQGQEYYWYDYKPKGEGA